MSFGEMRELVKIRHELRGLLGQGTGHAAAPLLAKLDALAARDPNEHAAVRPELQRWRCAFGLQE